MDPLVEIEPLPDQQGAAPALLVPGSGAQFAGTGGRRARAVFSLGLVALVLLASLAAWQGFLHSPWGQRLGALNQIVFVGGVTSTETSLRPQLYAMQPDGSGVHRLTPGGATTYFSPVWSPDGARIAAFVISARQGQVAHLVLMDADGSNAQVISAVALRMSVFDQDSGVDLSEVSKLISWSPDGSQLVVLVGVRQYILVQADGSRPHSLSAIRPTWSPDGHHLAYYAVAPSSQDGSGTDGVSYLIQLLDTQTFQTRLLSSMASLNAEALAWSPDGRYLAATAFSEASFRAQPIDSVVLLYPNTGKTAQVVRWLNVEIQEIAWSPDSQRLAVVLQNFDNTNFGGDSSGGFYLFVAGLDGSHILQVGPADDGLPSWSPDGKQLVYDSATDPFLLVADVTQSKAAIHQLASPLLSYLFGPCWSPLARLL